MNPVKHKKIAIVGGGPGGLTLARLLQMQEADVTVYERDAHRDARPKGATLDLHEESGLKALDEAGLMPAFRANYRPGADRLCVTDEQAKVHFDDDRNEAAGSEDIAASRPEIDRGPLQDILLDSLQPGTVAWDSQFSSMVAENDGWRLSFKNGQSAFADIVVSADGANSKIRPLITPIRPFYSGITIVEGAVYHSATAVPRVHSLLKGGKIFALGREQSLIVSSKGDGSLVFYTGTKTSEDWYRSSGIDFSDKEQVLNWFRTTYTGWDPLWEELFEHSVYFTPRPQYCMPLDQSWEALPNLTILGDAAHLMPPYAGEGVNMAMLDALELSQSLCNPTHADMRTAIAAYEQEMRSRASETARITMESTAALHSPDAIDFMKGLFEDHP